MRNPFEEKRKNERINRLVKENAELTVKVERLEQDYDAKRLYADLMEQAVKISQSQTQELVGILKELIPIATDGYRHHKSNGCHQDFLEDDRELLNRSKELLSKFNP